MSAVVRRRFYEAARRVLPSRRLPQPARPPYGRPGAVAELSRAPVDEAFITGNGIAARCAHILNYDVLTTNERGRRGWWFCKADYLEYFFREHEPRHPYVLFTHNSDRLIDDRFRDRADDDDLIAWFAQNPGFAHPKLYALPIGLSNPHWPHGDQDVLKKVQAEGLPKERLFDVSFNPATNPVERNRCLHQTRLELAPRLPFPDYLRRLAGSYFCISPNGNGVDCVRTWEALYVRTVPVVTRSLITDHHPDLPLIVLDDWSQFRSIEFSPELYEETMGDWTPEKIRLDRYFERIERIERTIAGLRRTDW